MPAVATIPVTIQPDAAEYLDRIGLHRELERILDYAKATIPYLRSLDVTLNDFPETGSLNLYIDAHRDPIPTETGRDQADREVGRWMFESFPLEVCAQIFVMSFYHDADER